MKRPALLVPLTLALGLGLGACGDSGPTAPVTQTAPIPRVAGTWSGTVRSLSVEDPWDVGPVCPAQPVSVELVQESGSRHVTGTIHADCMTAQLGGNFAADGSTLQGKVGVELGGIPYSASLSAALQGTRISAHTSVLLWTDVHGSSRRSDSIQLDLSR